MVGVGQIRSQAFQCTYLWGLTRASCEAGGHLSFGVGPPSGLLGLSFQAGLASFSILLLVLLAQGCRHN